MNKEGGYLAKLAVLTRINYQAKVRGLAEFLWSRWPDFFFFFFVVLSFGSPFVNIFLVPVERRVGKASARPLFSLQRVLSARSQ